MIKYSIFLGFGFRFLFWKSIHMADWFEIIFGCCSSSEKKLEYY